MNAEQSTCDRELSVIKVIIYASSIIECPDPANRSSSIGCNDFVGICDGKTVTQITRKLRVGLQNNNWD